MALKETIKQMNALLEELSIDLQKASEKGNKAAGTRVRKGCQDIKNLCQEIRVDVSNKKNA